MSTVGSSTKCDRCDLDLENAALDKCYVLNRINTTTGLVENLHYCLTQGVGEDGITQAFSGCALEVIDANIPAYDQRNAPRKSAKRKRKS